MVTTKGYDWECEECGARIAKTSRSSHATFERDLYTFTGTREAYERFQDDIDQDDDGCYHCCGTCGFGGSRPDIYHHRKRKECTTIIRRRQWPKIVELARYLILGYNDTIRGDGTGLGPVLHDYLRKGNKELDDWDS